MKPLIATAALLVIAITLLVLIAHHRGYRLVRHYVEDPSGVHERAVVLARPGQEPRVRLKYWDEDWF